jgi:hypothetical protein
VYTELSTTFDGREQDSTSCCSGSLDSLLCKISGPIFLLDSRVATSCFLDLSVKR